MIQKITKLKGPKDLTEHFVEPSEIEQLIKDKSLIYSFHPPELAGPMPLFPHWAQAALPKAFDLFIDMLENVYDPSETLNLLGVHIWKDQEDTSTRIYLGLSIALIKDRKEDTEHPAAWFLWEATLEDLRDHIDNQAALEEASTKAIPVSKSKHLS